MAFLLAFVNHNLHPFLKSLGRRRKMGGEQVGAPW
jgi:hypothetical protein